MGELDAGLWELCGDGIRKRDRFGRPIVAQNAADRRHPSARQELVASQDAKAVGHRSLSPAIYSHLDVELITQACRLHIAAGCLDTRPANSPAVDFGQRLEPTFAKHLVLGGLHEDEKTREVNDAAGVGVGKLDRPAIREDRRWVVDGHEREHIEAHNGGSLSS